MSLKIAHGMKAFSYLTMASRKQKNKWLKITYLKKGYDEVPLDKEVQK